MVDESVFERDLRFNRGKYFPLERKKEIKNNDEFLNKIGMRRSEFQKILRQFEKRRQS